MKLQIKKVHEEARIPAQQTSGSAGFDLHACLEDNWRKITVFANRASTIIGTGIAVQIPPKHVGLVFIRSGHAAKQGLMLANNVGVIDSDYQGEIMLACRASTNAVDIKHGERIAQMVIVPAPAITIEEVAEFKAPTKRGSGGFGSTGKES